LKIKVDSGSSKIRSSILLNLSFKKVVVFAIIFLMSGYVVVQSINFGIYLHKTNKTGLIKGVTHSFKKSKLQSIINYSRGLVSNPKQISLDINQVDYQKIEYLRQKSLSRGIILADVKKDQIPARLTYNGKKVKVNLSLTGMNLDHLIRHHKWSFRVKVKGDNTFMGMKEFSLLVPDARGSYFDNPVNEWVCHQLIKNEGLIGLRYDFLHLKINGKAIGIYAIEEHFDKRLIENNKLKEGIIIKPLSDGFFIYNKNRIEMNPILKLQLPVLKTLWESFMSGEIPAHKLFDAEKMGKFYAISDLVNGHHTHLLFNLRFYFNPITFLLEPISREWQSPYEPNFYLYIENPRYSTQFHNKLLVNADVIKNYLSALNRLSNEAYLRKFFLNINDNLNNKLNILYKDYPSFDYSNNLCAGISPDINDSHNVF